MTWEEMTELEKIAHIVELTKQVSADMRAEVLQQLNVIGETGDYPNGKLDDTDEGALKLCVSNSPHLVRIDFGKAVSWIALPKAHAQQLAIMLLEHSGAHLERVEKTNL